MKEYKIKQRKGIDDLQTTYAFLGSAQGDTSATNDVQKYIDSEGWLGYHFGDKVNKFNQEEINKESLRRIEENKKIVQDLKDNGEYGEEYEISISYEHNPIFDAPQQLNTQPLESYKMVFIDFNE